MNHSDNMSIYQQLLQNPQQFEFIQAMRIFERYAKLESVRLGVIPSLSFQTTSINHIKLVDKNLIQMQVGFMGLTGPQGVLPNHYTEILIQRLQQKDYAFKEFLDLFNHRLMMLYYQAHQKYWFQYEQYEFNTKKDKLSSLLLCLIGDEAFTSERISHPSLLRYSGFFSQQNRSAANLENILSDYVNLSIAVHPFQKQVLILNNAEYSRLFIKNSRKEQYSNLGKNVVLGKFLRDTQNKFRVSIGPLTYMQFKALLPGNTQLFELINLVKRYLGYLVQFDVQLILKKEAVPLCTLRKKNSMALGRDTWLTTKRFKQDATDTILSMNMESRKWLQ